MVSSNFVYFILDFIYVNPVRIKWPSDIHIHLDEQIQSVDDVRLFDRQYLQVELKQLEGSAHNIRAKRITSTPENMNA